jgi:uridine kinase
MKAGEAVVVAISGPTAVGKTTCVRNLAALLEDAATLFYDDYAALSRWHPDILAWIEEGCDPNQWVTIPQLVADLRTLRAGEAIRLPHNQATVEPARFIVMEEPWGREREEIRPLIDFVAYLHLPLDVALCRRLLREASYGANPMEFAEFYLQKRVREVYLRQQACGESADLVLDGTKPSDDLAREIVERVHGIQRS